MDTLFTSDENMESFQLRCQEVISTCFLAKSPDIHTQAAKDELKNLLLNCDFNIDAVIENLRNKNYNEERFNHFVEELQSKKAEILHAALIGHNSASGLTIVDFDWSLKMVLGSSELKSMKHSLLQLKLNSIDGSSIIRKKIYDMKIDMVEKLINELESSL